MKTLLNIILFGSVAFSTSQAMSSLQCIELFSEAKANQASLETLMKIQELTSNYDALALTPGSRVIHDRDGVSVLTITFIPLPKVKVNQEVPHLSEIQIEQTLELTPKPTIRSKDIIFRMNGQAFMLPLDQNWAPIPPSGASDRYSNSHYQGEIQLPDGKRVLLQVQMVVDMRPEIRDENHNRGFVDVFVSALKN